MIADNRINPALDPYRIGALILHEIQKGQNITDALQLIEMLKSVGISVSPDVVTLALDWLYIAGYIDTDQTGGIERCSFDD